MVLVGGGFPSLRIKKVRAGDHSGWAVGLARGRCWVVDWPGVIWYCCVPPGATAGCTAAWGQRPIAGGGDFEAPESACRAHHLSLLLFCSTCGLSAQYAVICVGGSCSSLSGPAAGVWRARDSWVEDHTSPLVRFLRCVARAGHPFLPLRPSLPRCTSASFGTRV